MFGIVVLAKYNDVLPPVLVVSWLLLGLLLGINMFWRLERFSHPLKCVNTTPPTPTQRYMPNPAVNNQIDPSAAVTAKEDLSVAPASRTGIDRAARV